jgi:hypothetical protein
MSLEAVKWAMQHKISDSIARSILVTIAFRADANGCCVTHVRDLARLVGLGVRETRQKLIWLRSVRGL